MVVRCPFCLGMLSVDGKLCAVCATGKINTEAVCGCGRPAIRTAGPLLVCAQVACYDEAVKPNSTQYSGGFSSENWEGWQGYGM